MFGVPRVELVALQVADRVEHPAALIDEQALAKAEHRLHMRGIDVFRGDESMIPFERVRHACLQMTRHLEQKPTIMIPPETGGVGKGLWTGGSRQSNRGEGWTG